MKFIQNPEAEKLDAGDDEYLDGAPLPDDVDGVPFEDVDGVPLHKSDNGLDGMKAKNTPLLKSSAAISALMSYDDEDDDDDIDGAPCTYSCFYKIYFLIDEIMY